MPISKFQSALGEFLKGRVCILGFGNRLWRDDGAGSILAERLTDCPGIESVDGGMVPENYLETVAGKQPDVILLVDACDFGGQPGELKLLARNDFARTGLSTHAGSPKMLTQYLEQRTGARLALLAIQPADTSAGDDLSPEVNKTVAELAASIPSLSKPQ